MDLFHLLQGTITVQMVSADIHVLLASINGNNITIKKLKAVDEITAIGTILRTDLKQVRKIAEKRGDKIAVIANKGIYWQCKALVSRPVLLFCLLLLLVLGLVLPGRILFIEVSGNETVSDKTILDAADQCGICIFASRRKVRSEKVKNALIKEIPSLQWVGVNTNGCTATILVSEKTITSKTESQDRKFCNIVASRDSVITACTVLKGSVNCEIGQQVNAGDILISGYADCGIKILATGAEGEIYGKTVRELEMKTPLEFIKRTDVIAKKKKYSIKFGKKIIKLYKDSGIYHTSCVKIYSEDILTLPGDFQLPISLVCETVTYYETDFVAVENEFEWITESAEEYLKTQMIAGQILDRTVNTQIISGICCLVGEYSCLEMIGRTELMEFTQG